MSQKKMLGAHKEKISFASKLLERCPEEDYIHTWTRLIMQEKKESPSSKHEKALVVFRLLDEWFGLSTLLFTEIAEIRKIHKIPHKSNHLLLGAVNMRGRLCLVFNLHHALDVGNLILDPPGLFSTQRLIAVQKDGEDWIFPIDEISRIIHFDLDKLENVPVTVSKSHANYLKGVIPLEGMRIGVLDDDLLFANLKRSLS